MVEIGRLPGAGGVADCAIMVEVILDVVGIGHGIVVAFVAGIAFSRCIIISIGVAGHAGQRCMSAGQWKLGKTVIIGGRNPCRRSVALGAGLAEIILYVIGVLHRVIILLVTGVTFAGDILISSSMAGDTLQIDVRPRQWELSIIVIEYIAAPV